MACYVLTRLLHINTIPDRFHEELLLMNSQADVNRDERMSNQCEKSQVSLIHIQRDTDTL